MIRSIVKFANMLDVAGYTESAAAIDSYLEKRAGAERHRELPIIASVIVYRRTGKTISILLEKRKEDPRSRDLALPGGHVEKDEKEIVEDFCVAAARELHEETGVKAKPEDLEFLGCRPRTVGKAKLEIVFAVDMAHCSGKPAASSDAADVMWRPLSETPDLAFEHNYFVELLAKKLARKEAAGKIDLSGLHSPNSTGRGTLIVFEGLDGAGKSSQIDTLKLKLKDAGFKVRVSKWASSDLFKKSIKAAKEEHIGPELYSLLHITDMHERYYNEITEALAQDEVVICDRYIYTSFARDTVRGVDPQLLLRAYSGFRKPDITFHCKCPVGVTVERLTGDKGKGLGYYGTGQDMHLDSDPVQNLHKYQKKVDEVYSSILPQVDAVQLDTNRPIKKVSTDVLDRVLDLLEANYKD